MDKLPYDQLLDMLSAARAKVAPGTRWQHYKGHEYLVKDLVLIEDTNEPSVVYASLAHPDISFVRPVTNWLDVVEWNGQRLPRFTALA